MAEVKGPVTTARPNGHARPADIEGDIDRTRAAMDRTFDALAGKLTPQQLMVEGLGAFKEGSTTIATKLVETAREHPVPATIIGLGIALLISEKSSGGETSSTVRDKADDAKTAASYGLHRAGERAGEMTDHLRERVDHVGERAHQVSDRVRGKAAEVPDRARRKVHDAKLGFWQFMDRQPLAVGAAALAAGLAAGLSIPETERENELMGEARDRLMDRAQEKGRALKERGQQMARTAAEVARSEAERQGLTPEKVVDKLQSVARRTEAAVKDESSKVVREASSAAADARPMPERSIPTHDTEI